MKFILCVEGHTEHHALSEFLRRWLNARLSKNVGVRTDNFRSGAKLLAGIQQRVRYHLSATNAGDIIAVIALIDLYGQRYPSRCRTVNEKCAWLTNEVTKGIKQRKFRMFCAVHETEAWLLTQPECFPKPIREALRPLSRSPETVDFDSPPSKLLSRLYRQKLNRPYVKPFHGAALFQKLDPDVAYSKCPWLRRMLDEMLRLAREAIGE